MADETVVVLGTWYGSANYYEGQGDRRGSMGRRMKRKLGAESGRDAFASERLGGSKVPARLTDAFYSTLLSASTRSDIPSLRTGMVSVKNTRGAAITTRRTRTEYQLRSAWTESIEHQLRLILVSHE